MVLNGGSNHLKSIHKYSMYMYIVKLIFAKENITIYQMYKKPQPCPVKILTRIALQFCNARFPNPSYHDLKIKPVF